MNTGVNGKHNTTKEDEIDFFNLIAQLLEHKWLILLVTATCVLLGGLYSSRQTPMYQSNILMQVEDNRGASQNMFSGISLNMGVRSNGAAIQTALIQSRFVLELVIKSLNLDVSINPKQNLFKRLLLPSKERVQVNLFSVPENELNHKFILKYEKPRYVTLYRNREKILEGPIGKILSNKNHSIKLSVNKIKANTGANFVLVKYSTEKIISNLQGHLRVEELGRFPSNTGILNITYTDTNPQRAVRILNAVAKETKLKDAEKKSLEASKTLQFLMQQLPLSKKSLEDAEFALNQYRAKSGKLDMKIQTHALIARLVDFDKQLAELHINETEMSEKYTGFHPNFQALQKQIAAVEAEKNRLEGNIQSVPASDQVAVNLMRDAKLKASLYTTLLNKMQELEVVKAGTISDIRILALAKLPDESLPGKGKVIYLGSFFIGFFLSFLIVFGRKMLFPRVEDPQWVERQYNIPNLAIVPYSKEQNESKLKDSTNDKKTTILLAQNNPRNLSIESLRSLRTSLQLHLSCAKNNIVSIVGISPSVGKSFISVNLAYLLATAEKKVLLIDADLRRGTDHQYFCLPPSPGVTELIQGSANLDEVIKFTSHKNLNILPRGDYASDPSELLSSERCREIIERLATQYDIIILDTAPILLVTDGALIGSISATNYLVLGSNIHRPSEIDLAIKRFSAAGVTIQGSIFNFHLSSSQKSPYYYRYYANHYYYDDLKNQGKAKKWISKRFKNRNLTVDV